MSANTLHEFSSLEVFDFIFRGLKKMMFEKKNLKALFKSSLKHFLVVKLKINL